MTSAKQWSDNSAGIEPGYPAHVRVIRDIQMEAFKAGMTRAIERLYNECNAGATIMADALAKDRDSLKPEDVK